MVKKNAEIKTLSLRTTDCWSAPAASPSPRHHLRPDRDKTSIIHCGAPHPGMFFPVLLIVRLLNMLSFLVGWDLTRRCLLTMEKTENCAKTQFIVGLNGLPGTSLLRQALISTQAPPAALPAVLPSSYQPSLISVELSGSGSGSSSDTGTGGNVEDIAVL